MSQKRYNQKIDTPQYSYGPSRDDSLQGYKKPAWVILLNRPPLIDSNHSIQQIEKSRC